MSILQPMIDAGDIVVPSGQMGMDVVGTLRPDGAVAQSRMDARHREILSRGARP